MSCRVSEVWNLKCVVKRAKQPNLPLLGGDTPPRRLRRELGSSLPSTGTASGAQSVTSCCAETSFLLMESRQPRFLPWAHLYSTNLFSQNGFSALSGSPLLQLGLNMANPPPPPCSKDVTLRLIIPALLPQPVPVHLLDAICCSGEPYKILEVEGQGEHKGEITFAQT